jgi:AraC-like DNA-binding protein
MVAPIRQVRIPGFGLETAVCQWGQNHTKAEVGPSKSGMGTRQVRVDRQNQNRETAGADPRESEPIADRWRVAGFEALELLRGSHVTQEYPRHWHEEIYLCATLAGESYLDCRGTSLETRQGTLAMVAPGDVHANRKIGCSFRCLLLEFRGLQKAVEQFVERNISGLNFSSELIEDQRTLEQFLKVHRAMESDDLDLGREDLAHSFLHELALRHGTANIPLPRNGNEDFAIRKTKHFLDEHYAERVSLHELARLMRMSAYHLNRTFRRKIGMPPHEYQVQVRIMRAKAFLRLGRSISETASLVGFVDQSHFTRHFKRFVGVTPGKFLQ